MASSSRYNYSYNFNRPYLYLYHLFLCRDTNKVCCYAHPDAPLIEDYRAGDMICSECGLVVGDRVIDVGSEWRTFSNEKSGVDPSRVGGPENPLLSGGDLSTIIGPGTGAASFDAFGSPKYQNRRTMSSSDRSLILAFKEISMMADRINLPKTIVDRANNLFKQVILELLVFFFQAHLLLNY